MQLRPSNSDSSCTVPLRLPVYGAMPRTRHSLFWPHWKLAENVGWRDFRFSQRCSSRLQIFWDVTLAEFFPALTKVFTTLTEVLLPWLRFYPCIFLSCKANAMVKLAKTGHGPQSSQLGHNFYAVSSSLILVWPLWVRIPVVNCLVLCIVCV